MNQIKLTEDQKKKLADRFQPRPHREKKEEYKTGLGEKEKKVMLNGKPVEKLCKKVQVSPKLVTELKRMKGLK